MEITINSQTKNNEGTKQLIKLLKSYEKEDSLRWRLENGISLVMLNHNVHCSIKKIYEVEFNIIYDSVQVKVSVLNHWMDSRFCEIVFWWDKDAVLDTDKSSQYIKVFGHKEI